MRIPTIRSSPQPLPLLPLATPRLRLRRFRRADLATFASYRNDPEVSKYQGWDHAEDAKLLAFIEEMAEAPELRAGSWLQVAIVALAQDTHIGDVGVLPDESGTVTLGYTLARHAQRQGYATEALTALIDALFRQHSVHRITASVDSRNDASVRLLERLCFRREAHLRESYLWRGSWTDEFGYGLLAREWLERHPEAGA